MDGNLEYLFLDSLRGADILDAGGQGNILVFAHEASVDAPVMSEEEGVRTFPGDRVFAVGTGGGVREDEVFVEVIYRIAQFDAVVCGPERRNFDDVLGKGDSCPYNRKCK